MKKSIIFISIVIILSTFIACNSVDIPAENEEKDNQLEEAVEDSEDEAENTIKVSLENPAYDHGNVLTVAAPSLKGVFNPVLVEDRYDKWIVDAVFDSLIGFTKKGKVVNSGIATDWKISEDRLTYTFFIRKGIEFHDGKELTAEDVAFTYYTIADPDYNGANIYAIDDIKGVEAYRKGATPKIEGVEIIDDYTIAFTINQPKVSKIREFDFGIMAKHYYAYDNWDTFKSKVEKPIGSGIMKFGSLETNEYVVLEKYEGYYREPSKINGVIVKVIPYETQPVAVASGEVDLANPIANIIAYEKMLENGIVNIQEIHNSSYRYIGFNLRKDKFSDKRVRQALAYGIRMDGFIEKEWKGFAMPMYSPILSGLWAAPEESSLKTYDYNPQKAQNLLFDAGWAKNEEGQLMKDGVPFVIEWTTYSDAQWSLNLISLAQNNWGELGIEVNAKIMDFNDMYDQVFNQQNFEVWNMLWAVSPTLNIYDVFHSDQVQLGKFNAGGFNNERSDELITAINNAYDQEKRMELYQEWAQLINEELPYLFVSGDVAIWGVNQRVQNIELGPYYDWVDNLDVIQLNY